MKLKSLLMAVMLLASAPLMGVASASAQEATPLRICTGGETGKYFQTAAEIGAQLKGAVPVEVVATNGSLDNFQRLSDGTCDAAIVQSDAYGIFTATNPTARLNVERVVPLYDEYVHLVCNRDAGINTVRDLLKNPDARVLVGPNGSGTSVTWQTWGKQSEEYLKVGTDPVGGTRAITRTVDGTDAKCLLFVAGLQSGTMMEVNELGNGSLGLVSVDDGAFDDVKDPKGQSVYSFTKIPGGSYPNLQNYGFLGGQSDIPTLAIGAILIANTSWIDANTRAFDAFSKASIRWSQQNKR